MDISKEFNDEVSHMLDLGDTALRFISQEGVSGWPTILGIWNRIGIDPDSYEWKKNVSISNVAAPQAGDDVHWYSLKNGNKDNIKRSIPLSVLKQRSWFTEDNILDIIQQTKNIYHSDKYCYFLTNSSLYYIEKDSHKYEDIKEANLSINVSFNDLSEFKDVISSTDCDFILSSHSVYRFKNGVFENIYSVTQSKTLNAFCLENSYIAIATTSGGTILSNIFGAVGSVSSQDFEYKSCSRSEIDTSSVGEGNSGSTYVTKMYTNSVDKPCTYCVNDGLGYFKIGGSIRENRFKFSDNSFDIENESNFTILKEDEPKPTIKDSNIHISNKDLFKIPQIDSQDEMYKFDNNDFKYSKIEYLYEDDTFYYLCTGDGLEIYPKTEIEGGYKINGTAYLKDEGITDKITGIVELDGCIYIVGNSFKMRSLNENDPSNEFTLFIFGIDYDEAIQSDKINVKELKLQFKDILELGTDNSKTYDNKIKKVNGMDETYVIGVLKCDDKTVFNLYGNDDRNRSAIELAACMDAFNMKLG